MIARRLGEVLLVRRPDFDLFDVVLIGSLLVIENSLYAPPPLQVVWDRQEQENFDFNKF